MAKRINTLYVLDNLTIGGAQKQVLDIVTHLDPRLFRTVVCSLFRNDGMTIAEQLKQLNIPLYQLQLQSWRDIATFSQFKHILITEQIDIVHGHTVPADFWGCLLAKLCRRCKTVYTRHNTYTADANWRMRMLNHWCADRIISISESIFNNLITNCQAPERKIVSIPNGVDMNRFHPHNSGEAVRAEFNIAADAVVIGNASRFEPRKGYDTFLQVAQFICRMHEHVIFIAIGHGEEKEMIASQINARKLQGKIILAEPRLEMTSMMAAFDLLLFTPYWGEGLPYIVLEAMASGKPVVASNIGSNRELIEPGATGFLPDPCEWQQETDRLSVMPFVKVIDVMLSQPKLMKALGAAARQFVEKKYNLQTMIKNLEKLYQQLVNEQEDRLYHS